MVAAEKKGPEEGSNKGDDDQDKQKNSKEEEGESHQEIVLKVEMHCEACARKVARSLRGFPGVEKVKTDCKERRVVVKAAKSVNPILVLERVQKKTARTVHMLSPLPPNEDDDQPPPPPPQPNVQDPPKSDQPPPLTTLLLQVAMHCEACAQVMHKRIRKIKGVESVETDVVNDRVTVKGVIDNPDGLVKLIYKRTRKQASIVEEEEKPEKQDKKASDDDSKKKQDDDKKEADEAVDSNLHTKSEHWHSRSHMESYYANYTPQMFSDENPNACSVM